MARIRLNQEYRNKIANRIKVHLQQEDTQEKRKYDTLKMFQRLQKIVVSIFIILEQKKKETTIMKLFQ